MKRRGYEYELCIAKIGESAIRMQNLSLSYNGSFKNRSGAQFCDLGFCNIRYKGSFKPGVVEMTVYHQQFG